MVAGVADKAQALADGGWDGSWAEEEEEAGWSECRKEGGLARQRFK